ncbi:CAP domain-containing protein [Paraburkholderia sp. J12]|uniref:CAP domain-containing protein n=1 Tax=Paraburkholderia sp. J12 TaxID=2805432 RepID=UPI002ABE3D19|nr:CAP domain-containing protein [Paraburkholderia sp. J12]
MKKTIIAAVAAGVLAGCGGGGGSSSTTTGPGSSASQAPAVALIAAPGVVGAGTFVPTGDTVTDTLAYINNMRAQVGLPPLASQPGVAQAATNHSLWEQDNNTVGHYETSGQPGYTGYSPLDRVNLYDSTDSVGEVTAGFSGPFASSTEAIEALFDAPFHRTVMLFDSVYAGVGVANAATTSQLSTLTVDFASYKPFIADPQLVAWPYNSMTGVDTSWFANESPNPMAASPAYEDTVVGYPVTLSGGDNAAFSNVKFAITDATGAPVACQETDSSNNAEATREAMCVPFSPLKTSMTYKVNVTGSLSNTSLGATPFSVSWSFTTAAAANTPIGAPTTSATRAFRQVQPRQILLN